MTPHELAGTPDLVELAGAARDAGQDVVLIERPMPDAVSIAGIGRRYDLVSAPNGVVLEDAEGHRLDEEPGADRLHAAGRLWQRLASQLGPQVPGPAGTGLVALGGFAFDPRREPADPWRGFPAVLFRVPALAVTRVRGRTFASGEQTLLELPTAYRGMPARQLDVEPALPEAAWLESVRTAAGRLQRGDAQKVVLAREVIAHGDGVVAAGAVARALRGAYPACFTYLVSGGDGTAFAGASPELLVRRTGREAECRPMAGSIDRGRDEAEDETLAARLRQSAKDATEHQLTASAVAAALAPLSSAVERGHPEVVRFTNIQHLTTRIRARLREPLPSLLDLAAALHPTPAVNGAPAQAACRLIDELEGMERGWYAGAVGWIDSRGDGELAVAIRCGLLWQDGARLYAGVGVMPDSDPEAELRETELKLRVLLGALSS